MKHLRPDRIPPEKAITLDGLFHERARHTPRAVAYRHFDDSIADWCDLTWADMISGIARWQVAMQHENLQPGDRVAIMLKNSPSWVMFDQAALGLGLVTVPLYISDRPDNVAHILQDSGARLLLIDRAEHWHAIHETGAELSSLARIVTMRPPPESGDDTRLRSIDEWLPEQGGSFVHRPTGPHCLASIVYTSGTTGRPKGVMLSHHNLLSNAWNGLLTFDVRPEDTLLSFLPLSHMLERTVGYYIPVMAGATVGYARSFQQLQEDFSVIRPTLLVSVPRIYERILAGINNQLGKGAPFSRQLFNFAVETGYSRFEHAQGRASWKPSHLLWPLLERMVAKKLTSRLGGNIRMAISGGAALSPDVSRVFIGLGLRILQGYGLTEASPVISVNRAHENKPASVGPALPSVEVRLGEYDVLQMRGPNVMQGYWNNEDASRGIFTDDGWLDTGDTARIDDSGHIFITGRVKDIIVLSNGEKVSPIDIEAAILRDPLFEQIMLVGEGKPYLSIIAVVNRDSWHAATTEHGLSGGWPECLDSRQGQAFALARIAQQLREFPGYARIRRTALLAEPWTIENGLLTPTLKLKRAKVLERYRQEYEKLYAGYLQQ